MTETNTLSLFNFSGHDVRVVMRIQRRLLRACTYVRAMPLN